MPINKIKYGNNTLIDLTDTTATASEVLSGYSFHDKTGALVQGSKTIDLTTVTVTPTNTTQVIVPGGNEYYLNIENMAPTSTSMSGSNPGTFWNISWSTQLDVGETYHITLDFYRAGYTRHYAYDDDITFNGFPFNITARSTSSSHTATMIFNTTQISNSLSNDEDNLTANRLTVSVFKESTAIGFSQVTVNGDADLISSNIRKGVNIFGVAGTYAAGSTPTYQTKTVTPTESQQTVSPDSGYDALSSVTVGAISSTYVGSGITRRGANNELEDWLDDEGMVVAPVGYYPEMSVIEIQSASHNNPVISVNTSTGLITASHTQSKGYVSVNEAGTTSGTLQLTTQATSTITPTETEQTAVSAGKYTLGDVKVSAISSTYIGSGITQRSSTDLSVSGATVTVPAGYYSAQATKSVASGSATVVGTVQSSPTITISNSGLITATNSAQVGVTPSVTAGYISSGTQGTLNIQGSNTKQLTTKAAATITPGTTNQTIAAGTYLTGTQTIAGDADLVASNIKAGVQIFGVTGNLSFITYYTGSSDPSSSLGSDGDIYLKVAS